MSPQTEQLLRRAKHYEHMIEQAGVSALYGPAEFWREVGRRHVQLIEREGFERFKRTVNFEYHQWRVDSYRDPKISRLFKALLRMKQLPYGPAFTRFHHDGDRMLDGFPRGPYRLFMGLLWQLALLCDRVCCLTRVEEPQAGSPLPVSYRGRLISQDMATGALEIARLCEHIDATKIRRVAEIGSGYGRLAFLLAKVFPDVRVYLFDIPPAICLAETYLQCVLGPGAVRLASVENGEAPEGRDHQVNCFLPFQLEHFPDDYFDLVINISSMDEMRREQVENYFRLIDRTCNGRFYLKGHARGPSWCPNSGGGLDEMPFPPSWRLVYRGEDVFSPGFVEKIFRVDGRA